MTLLLLFEEILAAFVDRGQICFSHTWGRINILGSYCCVSIICILAVKLKEMSTYLAEKENVKFLEQQTKKSGSDTEGFYWFLFPTLRLCLLLLALIPKP